MTKIVLADLADMQLFRGNYAASNVELAYGNIAVDAIAHATAADLLSALRDILPEDAARSVVSLLLEHRLTFDASIEAEIVDFTWSPDGGFEDLLRWTAPDAG